ncbi:MAG: serine hydrolase [Bdellovibrionota bacterium]
MKYSVFEKQLHQIIEPHILDVTPGLLVQAYQGGKKICDVRIGDTYAYYDLASVTKIIFPVQAMMVAYDTGLWKLESKVVDFVPDFKHRDMTVLSLLNHSSGFKWWDKFFVDLANVSGADVKKNELLKKLNGEILEPQTESVYSDLGFMTLIFVLEGLYKKSIYDIWLEMKERFYRGTTLEFHPDNTPKQPRNLYAPTEECVWRKKLIQGEVHDENTWALGGVSTHSGLFGSIDDLGWYALHMRSQLLGVARLQIKLKTSQLFAKRARPVGSGDWAMGFMMPTPGHASSGQYFSLNSIGHLGFTGTSVWYDPKADFAIVILSNRLIYGREPNHFKALRPKIHDWIVEAYRRSTVV